MRSTFILGLLVIIFIIGIVVTDSREKCRRDYDERQILIQYRGYRMSAFTAIIMNLIFAAAFSFIPKLPFDASFAMLATAFAAALVFIVYSIYKGAYFGINGKWKSWTIIIAIAGALNLYAGILNISQSRLLTMRNSANLLTGIFFAVIVIAVLVSRLSYEHEAEV